ncbi:MAG TPA: FAD-dependent oxidoreductase [Dehalococcoidia bacterium]|nr:FAD-dependent oxidoreductase [Dehalococcoidia bacterium]
MRAFEHYNAKTTGEAVTLLKKYGSKAKLSAGGTDLLGKLKDEVLPEYPEVLINIKTIPDLDYIREDDGTLKIGALTKLSKIATSSIIKERYDIISQAAQSVGSPQIRRVGTIGGNLCQDVRCWYYRYPDHVGGRILCYLKGGQGCYALTGENRYHSIFGGCRVNGSACSSACPAGVDIPLYLSLIRDGDWHKAAEVLLEANPFPSVTGRVCSHPCEQKCNRGDFDESVSVRAIERFIGDYILDNASAIIKPAESYTGKSVAIIGSGPAGLSAAYYLNASGYRVTVFDRMPEAGGMLTNGIPAYRLPKDVVKRVLESLEKAGVEFKLQANIGKDITLEALRKEYDSVFLATGAWNQPSIGVEGESMAKPGLELLTNVNRGLKEIPGKKVVVIGGGNVAVDLGITVLRLGAEKVTIACLESREEMPALESEIEQAIEEGVKLMPSWGPARIIESAGKVTGIEMVQCSSVFDAEGIFSPTYDDSIRKAVKADQIILAVGQTADISYIDPALPLKVNRGLIVIDPKTQETSMPGIFAGGEVTSGPATVIEAVIAGHRAATAIDHYLRGAEIKDGHIKEKTDSPLLMFNSECLRKTSRVSRPIVPISERRLYVEDAPGLDLAEVEAEAKRCFNCSCVAVNASDMAVVLIALAAKIVITGPGGIRIVPAQDFFDSLVNVLEVDEILTEIQVPRPLENTSQTFIKFRLRGAIDFAIVSVASAITLNSGVCDDARIVLGAVAPKPIRAVAAEQTITGRALNTTVVEAAAEAAVTGSLPLNMNEYKVRITKTLVKRALSSPDPGTAAQ